MIMNRKAIEKTSSPSIQQAANLRPEMVKKWNEFQTSGLQSETGKWKERTGWTYTWKERRRMRGETGRKEKMEREKWVSFSQFPIYFKKPGKLRAIPHSLTSLHILQRCQFDMQSRISPQVPSSMQCPGIRLMDLSDSSPPPTHTHTQTCNLRQE